MVLSDELERPRETARRWTLPSITEYLNAGGDVNDVDGETESLCWRLNITYDGVVTTMTWMISMRMIDLES